MISRNNSQRYNDKILYVEDGSGKDDDHTALEIELKSQRQIDNNNRILNRNLFWVNNF